MRRPIWSLGVLVGLAGAAHAVPTIDCTGLGELLGAEAGYVSVDDEVIEISVRARRRDLPMQAEVDGPELLDVLHPEDFCVDHGGLIAFILPVPKVNPAAPAVGPDLPVPGVGPDPDQPSAGVGHVVSIPYGMTPGKGPQAVDRAEESTQEALPDEPDVPQDNSPAPDEVEPAPSPSHAPEARATEGLASAGCATAPGTGPAGLGWLLAALVLLRRKGGAR